ncbi:MAG: hypothetical protein ABI222_16680 [Opitutaceae bacterium]
MADEEPIEARILRHMLAVRCGNGRLAAVADVPIEELTDITPDNLRRFAEDSDHFPLVYHG